MLLMNWKLSLSLAILGFLTPLNRQEEKGITELTTKGKLGCCCAPGLRKQCSKPRGLMGPLLRTSISIIKFSGKQETETERTCRGSVILR